jgi:hypothetical protein
MVLKLTVRLQAACRSRVCQRFGETAASYSHTYFEDADAPSHQFSQFPSDQAISSLSKVAYDEATYLWSILGYEPCEMPTDRKFQTAAASDDVGDDSKDERAEEYGHEGNTAISDRKELLAAIEASLASLGRTGIS